MREILKEQVKVSVAGRGHIIYDLLCAYYDGEIFKGIELDDINSEIYLPLEQRPSGILEALGILISRENNINDESDWTPLMMSVVNLDYYMTEYLIMHNANPNFWCDREDDIREHQIMGISMDNYYLEDIDTRILWGLNFSEKLVTDNILRLKLILEFEGVESFFGLCLSADKEHKEIKISSLQLKY